MTAFGVSLLSGGLDSTTVTAYARDKVDRLTAITFLYGQTHSKETDCAKQIAGILGVEHSLLDVSFLGDVAWYSALTHPERFPLPKSRDEEMIGFGIPITYVPLRNTIFVALSGALLESNVLHALEADSMSPADISARIYMAPNAVDYSGYPDCRPEFYERMVETIKYGSKLWTQYGIEMKIETPIIGLSKAEIAEMAQRIGAPTEFTWSCYDGGDVPCEQCDSCILRAKGFRDAGLTDPLMVRLGKA